MRRRALVLPIAAAAIAALCVYRLTRTEPARSGLLLPPERRPAPLFELLDHHSPQRVVRLSAYLGRQPVLVVFFNGAAGVDRDSTLQRVRQWHEQIARGGTIVIAVSTALPQENRKIIERVGELPFVLLSDPGLDAHRAWGRVEQQTGRPLPAAFLIDRAGQVAWKGDRPAPLEDPGATVDRLAGKG